MKQSIQVFLFVCSLAVLVSYQNCGQVSSSFGEYDSFSPDSDLDVNVGSFGLTLSTTTQLVDQSPTIDIDGLCSTGKSRSNRIEWVLFANSGYAGPTQGTASSGCRGTTFSVSIPVDVNSFNYGSGNSVRLSYIVVDSEGGIHQKTYTVDLFEAVISQDTYTVGCTGGSVPSSGASPLECDIASGLSRSSKGYSGMVLEAKFTPRSQTIVQDSKEYLLFSLVDSEYNPIFSYSTRKLSENGRYIRDRIAVYPGAFYLGSSLLMDSPKALYPDRENDDDKEEDDYHWELDKAYKMKLEFFYTGLEGFYQDPTTNAIGYGFISVSICLASNSSVCPVENFTVPAPFVLGALGKNGMKLVFGYSTKLSSSMGISWYNPGNWDVDVTRVKVCGSEFLYPTLENRGYCE